MTRRPAFWIVFTVLGTAGVLTAIRLFTVALPNVSIEIDMDRDGALTEAASLADRFDWGLDSARSAASFGQVDPEVQTYVELEGGGRGAFQELMNAGVYQPYQWRVRRFVEGEVQEVEVRFSPGGAPYGFRLRLGEDDPGSGNLDEEGARATAELGVADWSVVLTTYDLIESSEEVRPGGRVDHTFVYERGDVTLGDARFRLRLVVAGERLAELTHFVFVPEAFSREYADMRSTNDAIALVSQSFVLLVYVLLGAGLGTAILLRKRWIEWRPALAWGAVIAVLFGMNSVNALPLSWMEYDTALPASTFVLQNLAVAAATVILGTPILAFFLLAGESLGRRAFPEHLQQWRFWSPSVAASKSALGLTCAAYLLVGVQLGYVTLFYLGTSRLEGWWSPADALVQPDLVATYLPWMQAVSVSLFASFWEESMFRAVPIACAALIGARLGRRNVWIWGAVVVQAVVFAAGHANYPQLPAYARVVELFPPAFVWGVVYVFFGLVPTILAHFLYDLALISSVLFASEALVDQGVIVLVAAVPLAIVLWARRTRRAADTPPAWAFNHAWSPPEPARESGGAAVHSPDVEPTPDEAAAAPGEQIAVPVNAVRAAGAAGLVLWIAALAFAQRPPRLAVSRDDAIEAGRSELSRLGYDVDGWSPSAVPASGRSQAHRYVYEEAGPEAFDSLVGEFLASPQWVVRFVDWQAEPAERVEEFLVNVEADGSIRRVVHRIPEARPGPELDENEARVVARGALPPGTWDEVGAEERAHESRTDWEFTFRDPSVLAGVAGEGRAAVSVLGNEVTNVRRFVDVPEEWERERREAEGRRSVLSLGVTFTLVFMFGVATVVAIVVWSRHQLATSALWKSAGVALPAMALSLANAWPATTSLFATEQPYGLQAGGVAVGIVLGSLVFTASIALVIALAHSWAEPKGQITPRPFMGVAIGLLLAGLLHIVPLFVGGIPSLPDYAGAAAFFPTLAAPLDAVLPFLIVTAGLSVLGVAHRRFADRAALRGLTTFVIVLAGVFIVPDAAQGSTLPWIGGLVVGVAVVWGLARVIGTLPVLAPTIVATVLMLQACGAALDSAYAGAGVGHLLAVFVLGWLAWAWTREWVAPALTR